MRLNAFSRHDRRHTPQLTGLLAVALLTVFLSAVPLCAENLLANPSFEGDAAESGIPSGWQTDKTGAAQLTDIASDGAKAVAFTEGYGVLQQDLQLPDLAGRNLRIKFDARSVDGAKIGLFVGHMHEQEDGKLAWGNHQLMWERSLGDDYTTHRAAYRLPENARGPRLWICIYRSNRAGTLFVDNTAATINELTPDEQVTVHRLERDWRYLTLRARMGLKHLPDSAPLRGALTEASLNEGRCFGGELELPADVAAMRARQDVLSAQINRALCPDSLIAAAFSRPYEQLGPGEALVTSPGEVGQIVALPGEHCAIGLTLASGSENAKECRVSVEGLAADTVTLQVRKQGFMETWYQKEHELIADPLGLLPQRDGAWIAQLSPGEVAKLCLQLQCNRGPLDAEATVVIEYGDIGEMRLPLRLTVPGSSPAPADGLDHIVFMYPTSSVAAHSPDLTGADLGAHGVTMIEFPYPPECEFSPDGELLKVDFTRQEAWLKAYCPHVRQMMIFWAPALDKLKCGEDETLVPHTEAWNRAYVELLRAFLARAEELGYGPERFAIMPCDEPHSASLGASPDEGIRNVVSAMKLLKDNFPDLEQVITLSNYTFPADLELMAPLMDIAVPHWPFPDSLSADKAPADYSPREAYAAKMRPMLEVQQAERGMRIWSYHVAGGKSDSALIYNRAYPIRAVAAGETGFGTWAYNVSQGSAWDDTDGGGPDYIYVYDGVEKHDANQRLNPTGEAVITSVRWEALRAGLQDGRLLLKFVRMVEAGTCPAGMKPEADRILAQAKKMAQDDSAITWASVEQMSTDLKRLWASIQ